MFAFIDLLISVFDQVIQSWCNLWFFYFWSIATLFSSFIFFSIAVYKLALKFLLFGLNNHCNKKVVILTFSTEHLFVSALDLWCLFPSFQKNVYVFVFITTSAVETIFDKAAMLWWSSQELFVVTGCYPNDVIYNYFLETVGYKEDKFRGFTSNL